MSSPTITRPGWQVASSRAAVLSTSPTRSSSPSPITSSPVLIPTRMPSSAPCRSRTESANARNRRWSSRPAATARSASSSAISGIPKIAITPSPMNFTTVPAWSSMVDRRMSKYGTRAARAASGSTCSPNDVDPTRSPNSAVTCLRTAAVVEGGAAAAAGTSPVSSDPHWLQNLEPAACSASQDGQRRARGAPHSEQNFASASLS